MLRLVCIDQGFYGPVKRIDTRAGIGHVEALARGVHDGLRDLEQVALVKPVHHLHQHTNAGVDGRARPTADGPRSRIKQGVRVSLGVDNAQLLTGIRGYFFALFASPAGLVKHKAFVQCAAEVGAECR